MSHRFNGNIRNSFVCRECLAQNIVEVVDKEELKEHLKKYHHHILARDSTWDYIPYSAFHAAFQKYQCMHARRF